ETRGHLGGFNAGWQLNEDPSGQAPGLQMPQVGGRARDVPDERALEQRAVASFEAYLVVVNEEVVAYWHPGHGHGVSIRSNLPFASRDWGIRLSRLWRHRGRS